MTDEEINLAIAKAVGWTEELPSGGRLLLPYRFYNINTKKYALCIPDYCNDLNAMHEAEKQLGKDVDLWARYDMLITQLSDRFVWFASARLRAEAFLRTINKWKE